jgi:WXG100 family type VII secretion target
MSGGIKVTPEMLHELGGQCHAKAGELQGASDTLRGQVASVVGSTWSSSASAQFDELHQKWQRGQHDMHEALLGIGTLLHRAGTAYSDSEHQIRGFFTA